MPLNTKYKIQHFKYLGKTSADGYPSEVRYGPAVDRKVFGWYPSSGHSSVSSSSLAAGGEYSRRVVSSKVLLVPDVGPYEPLAKIVLPQPASASVESRTYFISEDVRDYSTGPFVTNTKGGEIVIERVTG